MPRVKGEDDKLAQNLRVFRNTKDFAATFQEITGAKLEDNEVKACLLQLVYLAYKETEKNYLMKRDIVLTSWGLLREYSSIATITERRKQYIKDTGYIARYKYDKELYQRDPDSTAQEDNIKSAIINIIQHENVLYLPVAKYYNKELSTSEGKEAFIKSAKDAWLSKDSGEVLLPSRSDYDLATEEPDEPNLPDNNEIQTESKDKFRVNKFIIIFAVIAVLAIAGGMLAKTQNKQTSAALNTDESEEASLKETEAQATINPATLKLVSTKPDDYEKNNDWGDASEGRYLYANDEVNKGELRDSVVLNSIIDASVGDESKFVGARILNSSNNVWTNDIVTVEDGETYTICLFVHNDNPNGLDAIAEGVKAAFKLPDELASRSHTVYGTIESKNATTKRYWDTVTFLSEDYFCLEYISGSAKYINSSMGTISISDEVISQGHPLGYDRFDGKIPGGDKYEGVVTIEVIAKKAEPADLKVFARIDGTKVRNDMEMTANVGDTIEYVVEYNNKKDSLASDVIIKDDLPDNLEYIEGTTVLYNYQHQDGVSVGDNLFSDTGINIGDYDPKGNAYILFKARIVDDTLTLGQNTLTNVANVEVYSPESGTTEYSDQVAVIVNK